MINKNPIVPLLLINFIGTFGFSIVFPFLVFLVTDFGGNALVYGILGATYSAFQFIGGPILGRWSDRFGRRKILLLCQLGTLVAWLIFLWALYFPVIPLFSVNSKVLGVFVISLPLMTLFLARALDGVTGGNVSVANAYLADITTKKDRKKNYGKMAAAANLGFIAGPLIAGILGATIYGVTLPVVIAIFVSIIASFVIAFYLPDLKCGFISRDHEQLNVRKVLGQEHKNCYSLPTKKFGFRDVLKIKNVGFIMVLYFLIFLGFNVFYSAFPFYSIQKLGWSILQMGIFFSVMGLIMAFVQGPVLKRISGKYSDRLLIISGSALLALSFIFIIVPNMISVYLGVVFFAIGNGVMWPSVLSVLSIAAGDQHQGAVQGFAGSAGSLASIIGLILGGVLFTLLGSFTFLISALVIFTVFILSFRLPTLT